MNLCVYLVSAIIELHRRWWSLGLGFRGTEASIETHRGEYCAISRLNLRMCEGVDPKPSGSYNELATCHAQRSFLAIKTSILEAFVRPSVQMERGRAQNGLRFKDVL